MSTTTTEQAQRTRQEIEGLKRDWLADPCWDIEDTAGFEAHREELMAFHREQRARWEAERTARLAAKAEALGCPGNLALAQHVIGLERRLDRLEEWARSVSENVSGAPYLP